MSKDKITFSITELENLIIFALADGQQTYTTLEERNSVTLSSLYVLIAKRLVQEFSTGKIWNKS